MLSKILKVSEHQGQFKITLPRQYVLQMGWEKLGYVMITMYDEKIMLIEPPNPSLPEQLALAIKPSPDDARTWRSP